MPYMRTLIHIVLKYEDIVGGICPKCQTSLDECAFPTDYSKLLHPGAINGHDYEWGSDIIPVNRGMIWCNTCRGAFVMDPFVCPTKISTEESKIKYPQYIPTDDPGDDDYSTSYWEISLAKIDLLVNYRLINFIANEPLSPNIITELVNKSKLDRQIMYKYNIYYHPFDNDPSDELLSEYANESELNETVIVEQLNPNSYLSLIPLEIVKYILKHITLVSPLLHSGNDQLIHSKKINLGWPINNINIFCPEIPFPTGIKSYHDGLRYLLRCTSQTGDQFYYNFWAD